MEDPTSNKNNALQNCAKALLVLVQMIAESTRFQLITEHIASNTNWYNSVPLTSQLISTPLPTVPYPNPANIWTVGQANAALGILLYVSRTSSRLRCQADVDAGSARNADTNVSYVRTVVILSTERDYESKGPNKFVTLTGPSVAISSDDVSIISVSLWDFNSLSSTMRFLKTTSYENQEMRI
ncbi:hypothetical protein SCA6_009752 [Theobroma cacao]